MNRFLLFCQRLKYRAVQTALSVNIGCHNLFPHDGSRHSGIDRHVNSQLLADIQSVDQGLVQRLISCNNGDSQKFDGRVLCRHHHGNGVIMSRITVQNNFSFLHSFFSSSQYRQPYGT